MWIIHSLGLIFNSISIYSAVFVGKILKQVQDDEEMNNFFIKIRRDFIPPYSIYYLPFTIYFNGI